MLNKRFSFPLMLLLAIVQLAIAARMIYAEEHVLREGKVFWFKTAAVDPSDPFRGKYINLNFDANHIAVPAAAHYERGNEVYVTVAETDSGFCKILALSQQRPSGSDYILATVSFVSLENNQRVVYIDYPFSRYYMNEFKAMDAEKAYADGRNSYAVVRVWNGRAVLEAVVINGQHAEKLIRK